MRIEGTESSELTGAGCCNGILFSLKIVHAELLSIALMDMSRSKVKVEELDDGSISKEINIDESLSSWIKD